MTVTVIQAHTPVLLIKIKLITNSNFNTEIHYYTRVRTRFLKTFYAFIEGWMLLSSLKSISFMEIWELKSSLSEALSQRNRDKTIACNVISNLYIADRTLTDKNHRQWIVNNSRKYIRWRKLFIHNPDLSNGSQNKTFSNSFVNT